MTLRFQPARLLTPVLLVLILVAVSYWVNPEPWKHLGLREKLLFGGAALVFAGLMVGMRTRSYLRMEERGLEIKYVFGAARFYAWRDIEAVRIVKKRIFLIPVLSSIGLKLREAARPTNAVRRAAGGLVGYDVSFLAVYDESAEEIAEKIASFKRSVGAL
jgi:hypothetical protein